MLGTGDGYVQEEEEPCTQEEVGGSLVDERHLRVVVVTQSCLTLCEPMEPCQAPQSMGFSRQRYRSGLPVPSPGDLPNPGTRPGSLALQMDSLPSGAGKHK